MISSITCPICGNESAKMDWALYHKKNKRQLSIKF